MLSLRTPVAILLVLIITLVLIMASFIYRMFRMNKEQNVAPYDRYTGYMLWGLLILAIFGISAFGFYVLYLAQQ